MRFTKLCIPPCAFSVGRVSAPDSLANVPHTLIGKPRPILNSSEQ